MSDETSVKRGPGRPKGSKNKPRPEAAQIPAQCVKCGSANLVRIPGFPIRERQWRGNYRGFAYVKIQWIPKKCKNCGQRITVRNYLKALVSESKNGTHNA